MQSRLTNTCDRLIYHNIHSSRQKKEYFRVIILEARASLLRLSS